MGGAEVPTLGVEEEWHVLDGVSGLLRPRAPAVLARLGEPPVADGAPALPPGAAVVGELTLTQVEAVTGVCSTLDDLDAQVRGLRRATAHAAAVDGLVVASCGTPPLGGEEAQEVSDDPRYAPLLERAGALVSEQVIAGVHVHLGVPDRDDRAVVLDALRPWLPVLLALSASSPFWRGRDTGFASWRQVHWHRWPVTGPPPRVGTAAGFDAACDRLVAAGVVDDASYAYWDARLSTRFPTVEVRVLDAVLTAEEVVVLAGLCRGLAVTALQAAAAGREPLDPPGEALRAWSWRAARVGTRGPLVDPLTGRLAAADHVVRALLGRAAPGLAAAGDEDRVDAGVERLLREGDGAARMRRALARDGAAGVLAAVDVGAC